MKITLINGSPKGRESNSNMMAAAFLMGAQEAGAETVNITLADNEIKHCKGCFSCWFGTPGRCVIDDDMAGILSVAEGADILVLATPLRYGNISGLLKVFIERMVVFANPYIVKDQAGETRHPRKSAESESPLYRSKLVLLASGGLSQRAHFQVVSLWIKRLALNNLTEVIGEIYAPQGALLTNSAEELRPVIDNYLQLLKKAGQEITIDSRISDDTVNLLEQNLIPEEIYLQQINDYFDSLLTNVKHPYVIDQEVEVCRDTFSLHQNGDTIMDSNRFIHLRDLVGYDNLGIAKMFNIEIEEIDAFCLGTKKVPVKLANDLELFADWCCEVSHTAVKRELAQKHLNKV